MATERDVYEVVIQSNADWVGEQFAKAARSAHMLDVEFASVATTAQRTSGVIEASTRRATTGFRGMHGGIQGVAYILDDLQYVGEMGLRPIINNVMMIAPALGIAMMAADQLWRNWDRLTEAFDASIRPIASATEELAKLEKQTKRTADEEQRYQQLKERGNRLGALKAAMDPESRRQRDAAFDAMTSDPGLRDAAVGMTMEQRNPGGVRLTDADREKARGRATTYVGGMMGAGTAVFSEEKYQHELKAIEREKRKAELEASLEQVNRSFESPEQLAGLIGSLRNAGKQDEANRLEKAIAPGFYEDPVGPTRDQLEAGAASERAELAGLAEANDDANLAEFRRKKAENERKARDVAGSLMGGAMGGAMLAGAGSKESVERAMKAAGFSEETAGRRAGQVFDVMAELTAEQVQAEALRGGGTEAQARARLIRMRGLEQQGDAMRRRGELLGDQAERMRSNRPSQVMDPMSLITAIQSSVGGKNYLQEQIDSLRRLESINDRQLRELRNINRF